jgi:ABC-type multidrug transport system fused ATPase/permease subunit
MGPLLRAHQTRLGLGFVCILLTNAFMLAAPWITKYAVDSLAESVTRQKLAWYGGVIVVLALMRSTFQFFMRWLIIGVSRDVELSNTRFATICSGTWKNCP